MRRVRSDGQDLRRRLQIQWQGIVVVIRVLVDVVALLEVVDDALRGLHVRHKGCLQLMDKNEGNKLEGRAQFEC